MRNKTIKVSAIVIIGLAIITIGFYFFFLYPRYSVPVLTYHSIDREKTQLSVTPENFEKQMRYLKDKHYNVISFGELVEGIKNGRSFAHNSVVITMDDGCKNNFSSAYPILKKYSFPVIIFLPTSRIGADPAFLSWNEVKEMSKHNISFGGHTKNHITFTAENKKDNLWDEIAGCKKTIEGQIGMPVDYFCYPLGKVTAEAVALVKRAGYKGACVTKRGYSKLSKENIYEIRRFSVRDGDPYFSIRNLARPVKFRAILSGYYNIFKKYKREN